MENTNANKDPPTYVAWLNDTSSSDLIPNMSVVMVQFISQQAYDSFFFVTPILNEGICMIGVVTNIINIIVFVKLGLRETTSISMLSLAVSDLLSAAFGLWSNLLYLPQFPSFGLPLRLVRSWPKTKHTSTHTYIHIFIFMQNVYNIYIYIYIYIYI